jgi:aminopeptidase N
MNDKGLSFKAFLRDYFTKYKYTTHTTPQFQQAVTEASGLDLSRDFDQYIYGRGVHAPVNKSMEIEDPMHPKFTKDQLRKMTWL